MCGKDSRDYLSKMKLRTLILRLALKLGIGSPISSSLYKFQKA